MKLWEVLKTGKKFKRPKHKEWSDPYAHNSYEVRFTIEAWRADDWEVEPELGPRRLAWINKLIGHESYGEIRIVSRYLKFDTSIWERAPWLDQPEEGDK